MTEVIETRSIFRDLTGEDVLTALDDSDPKNPVTVELNRLVEAYADSFSGRPNDILQFKPRWPIEIVALGFAERYF
jgi:hypothetical protein